DYQGKKWDVKCDTDYPGNDIATVACETFEHCFRVCTDYPGCVAFSYLPGICYLKERALHPVSKPNVDAAALVDPPAHPTTT
ncbi:uncharacterized protein K489DRAFT_298863, partial [Dissoconium aciculare CBS 342.82]|uniref:Apple domain-containing protein n=1 Tax=Dissoconium aciculare CBS 342.82 TaxID=1314786 RepID=A0A6J3M3N4_9PEZI